MHLDNSRPNLRSVQQRIWVQVFPKLARYYADLYSNSKPQLIPKFTLILSLSTFLKEFSNNIALFNLRF